MFGEKAVCLVYGLVQWVYHWYSIWEFVQGLSYITFCKNYCFLYICCLRFLCITLWGFSEFFICLDSFFVLLFINSIVLYFLFLINSFGCLCALIYVSA